jgi:formylmethanofuran dehydrogenase subunit E
MTALKHYLEKAEAYHGHICSGQILGIRMALLGLKLLRLKPEDDLRDLVIFLETDRCVADAAYVVTGVTVGRRRVKMFGYGKTAMSFLDLKSGRAFRVCVKTSDRPPTALPRMNRRPSGKNTPTKTPFRGGKSRSNYRTGICRDRR